MNGQQIPNDSLKDLPIGTELLILCIDEDYWFSCTLERNEHGLYLSDNQANDSIVTYLDDIDFLEAYEFDAEDARILIKEHVRAKESKPRYVFDGEQMVIWDTVKNHVVCLVDTRRPDLLEGKISELLELANR